MSSGKPTDRRKPVHIPDFPMARIALEAAANTTDTTIRRMTAPVGSTGARRAVNNDARHLAALLLIDAQKRSYFQTSFLLNRTEKNVSKVIQIARERLRYDMQFQKQYRDSQDHANKQHDDRRHLHQNLPEGLPVGSLPPEVHP